MGVRMKFALLLALLVTVVSTFLSATEAMTAIYYVDQNHPNASDSNSGTTEDAPWLTLRRAMSVVAGDTVHVKDGTYNGGATPFYPENSGTATAPIAFRAFTPAAGPRHRPVLTRIPDTSGSGFNIVMGVRSDRNYIIWDGFVLAPDTNALIGGSTGIILENLDVNFGARPCTPGNVASIYMDNVRDVTIRNSRIRGAYYTSSAGCEPSNAAGIWMIRAYNILIHNNEISDAGAGIEVKRISHDHIYEKNYIHDIQTVGIGIGSATDVSCSGIGCRTSDIIVRNNILVRTGTLFGDAAYRVTVFPGVSVFNMDFYNNTLYLARSGSEGGSASARFYNNIIHLDVASPGRNGHIKFWNGVPSDLLSNYSMYLDTGGQTGRFYPAECCSPQQNFFQWQITTGQDLNSQVADPLFVGPLTGALSPSAFQLQPGSPARDAGGVGGIATGAPVNMGAYVFDSDLIGVPDSIPPSRPLYARFQ